ncbi:MAG: BamA/TamA family outer membrane protein [Bacteroidetes bacterium]|nr:BamA/TamA family outer membrane protein [Candidatus Colenecus caballi]
MKRITAILATALLCLPFQAKEKDEIIKTGWNLGPLPVVGFDSDLGFQYGLCCDFFNYGDGTNYPQYNFKINVEASTYTKGSSVLRSYGDFKTLIPNGKLFYDVTYFNAPKFGFYGFNGLAAPYDKDKKLNGNADAKSGFNFMSRNQFRAIVSIQKQIAGPLNWAAGLAFYHTTLAGLGLEEYEGQTTLYDLYKLPDVGLIRENEKDGGNVTQLRAGLTYDTRDHDSDPSKGMNIEATLVYSPDIIDGNGYDNLGFTFMGSHFVPVISDKLTFAYRLLVQAKLWGEIPYYFTNNVNTMFFRKMYTEAIGGNASVRGLNRNGVLGDGFAMLNMELRWHAVDFQLINQNWSIVLNPFYDLGRTIQPYRYEQQKASPITGIWSGQADDMHYTAGLGVKIIMNHNMVLSIEGAKALLKNDGSGLWTNVGFNYLF